MKRLLAALAATTAISGPATAGSIYMLLTAPTGFSSEPFASVPVWIETTRLSHEQFDGTYRTLWEGRFTTDFTLLGQRISASGTTEGRWGFGPQEDWTVIDHGIYGTFEGTTDTGESFAMGADVTYFRPHDQPRLIPTDPGKAFTLTGDQGVPIWNLTVGGELLLDLDDGIEVFVDPTPVPVPAAGAMTLSLLSFGGILRLARRRTPQQR